MANLIKAGVEEPVVLEFIKNSDVPYAPVVQDILELRRKR